MNLIEQLGGYANAKAIKAIPAETFDSHGVSFTRKELEQAMLEYRRQNNIFEVGDKVTHDMSALDEIFTIQGSKGFEFLLDDGDWIHLDDLEHATDAEIKAGKRLEVS